MEKDQHLGSTCLFGFGLLFLAKIDELQTQHELEKAREPTPPPGFDIDFTFWTTAILAVAGLIVSYFVVILILGVRRLFTRLKEMESSFRMLRLSVEQNSEHHKDLDNRTYWLQQDHKKLQKRIEMLEKTIKEMNEPSSSVVNAALNEISSEYR